MKTIVKAALLLGALIAPSMAAAQQYPSKTVTIVVPFPPGGSNDTVARYLAPVLSELWKQTVVVANRPGAGTIVGTGTVTKAEPDGYTLLFVSGDVAANAAVRDNMPFSVIDDLQPVAIAMMNDRFAMTGSRTNIPTLADLVKESKAKTIFYGTSGIGGMGHFSGALLNDAMGINMQAVHYSGGAAAIADLGGGRIDVFFGSMIEVNSGIGKPIAVLGDTRSPALPDVPTVVEAGFPDAQVPGWLGVFAPAKTPENVVNKINADVYKALSTPEARKFLAAQAGRPSDMSAKDFTAYFASYYKKMKATADKHSIRSN